MTCVARIAEKRTFPTADCVIRSRNVRNANSHQLLIWACTVLQAAIAQLGERQTEDLKVPGSIPGRGTFFIFLVANIIRL